MISIKRISTVQRSWNLKIRRDLTEDLPEKLLQTVRVRQESGAFSFYYLCFRDGRQVAQRVGETFAALCGRKEDAEYVQMGRELYIRFLGQVKHFANTLDFVKETV